jgi:hypothetical protein
VVSVSGAEVCDPTVGSVPDRPATPRHVVAFVADHVSSTAVFGNTDVWSAVIDTSGGYHTFTVTLAVATPPRPEHEIVYVEVRATATLWAPAGPTVIPGSPIGGVHAVALVDDHVSVTTLWTATSVAELVSVTVGAGGGDDPPPHPAIARAKTAVTTTQRDRDRMASPPGCGPDRSTYKADQLRPNLSSTLNPPHENFHRGCW